MDIDLVDVKLMLRVKRVLGPLLMHAGEIHEDGGDPDAFLGSRLHQGLNKASDLAQVEQLMVKPKPQLIIIGDNVLDGLGNFDHGPTPSSIWKTYEDLCL